MTNWNISQSDFNPACQSRFNVVRIPAPQPSHGEALSYLTTFNDLSESPAPHTVGQVKDMATFSQSLGLPDDAKKDEFWVKATGTDFYILPQYRQFEEAARQMINIYYAQHGEDGPVAMAVHQAVIQPKNEGIGLYRGGHKDINLDRIKSDGKAPNVKSFIVSDCLGTGFSNYRLTEEDIENIEASENPNTAIEKILNKPDVLYKSVASPGTILAFPATAGHALANPAQPMRRTVMIMAFFPHDEPLSPENTRNPWLTSAMTAHDKNNSPEINPNMAPV